MWRKLRGLLGIGVTWGALWGMLGAAIGVAVGWVFPDAWTLTNPIVEWAIGMGLYGFVSGVGFGGLLTLGEGSKRLRELSLPRVAMWGVLGSAAVPILFGLLGTFDATTTIADVIGAVLVTGFLGGTFAPGAIMIARRAELARPEEMDLLE
ncbi:MAG: hypothetical protein O2958_10450 [Gemmatimonadetes bacterium]|nr:hypothetical protein [Gemmatimonadota bacterium]MDA1103466.1 hypothetical protein [Gemmatimonadota bacterium]